jgi:uncharacterized membrane protein YeiH
VEEQPGLGEMVPGLPAGFVVQGSFIALKLNSYPVVIVIMGGMTEVGGGLIRAILD